MREFIPLARSTTNFNWSVDVGGGRLAPLRAVKGIEDYVAVAEHLAELPEEGDVTGPSPITLPAALDYLGLVLDRDTRWEIEGATLRLASVADTALDAQPPQTHAEFDQRISVTWNLLNQLRTPTAAPNAYERRDWDAKTSGSLNNLDIWLADSVEVAAETAGPLQILRALGRIRQSAHHANAGTRGRRDEALVGCRF